MNGAGHRGERGRGRKKRRKRVTEIDINEDRADRSIAPPPIVSAPQDLVYLRIKMLESAPFLEEDIER